jgi:hypothetical protein
MTEGTQVSNITAQISSIFAYITTLFLSPSCPRLPDVPNLDGGL